jgi:hypothetical protein
VNLPTTHCTLDQQGQVFPALGNTTAVKLNHFRDLLRGLLAVDPVQRLNPAAALGDAYFEP